MGSTWFKRNEIAWHDNTSRKLEWNCEGVASTSLKTNEISGKENTLFNLKSDCPNGKYFM